MLLERTLKLLKRISRQASPNGTEAAHFMSQKHLPDYKEQPSAMKPALNPSKSDSKEKLSTMQLLKWSFREKKEVTAIVEQLTERNDRISDMVRFWSLASEIGVDLRHLNHLHSDKDAMALGLQDDVSLVLAVSDANHVSGSFELHHDWNNILKHSKTVEDRFASFNWNGRDILQENCVCLPREEANLGPQIRTRINSLVELLHRPKEQLFCILDCQGWSFAPHAQRVSYIFNIPSDLSPEPRSLLRLLHDPRAQPSLEAKFTLAYSLARSVAQLHMVKWVNLSSPHLRVRSNTIMIGLGA